MTRRALRIVRSPRRSAAGFTLAELLVSIAVILIIAGITAVSVRNIARDARLSSGVNTVTAALDTARGLAIRDGRYTIVAFRARLEGTSRQYIEVVTARAAGHIPDIYEAIVHGGPDPDEFVERFVPVSGLSPRRLPPGISIAAPKYGGEFDTEWQTTTNLPAVQGGENAGVVIAVMYGPDGTIRLRREDDSAGRYFIDFNNDGDQRQDGEDYDNQNSYPDNAGYCDAGQGYDNNGNIVQFTQYFCQAQDGDEPYLTMAPFLAVFDEAAARDEYNPITWSDPQTKITDLSAYITANADRLHFNRYTGVILK